MNYKYLIELKHDVLPSGQNKLKVLVSSGIIPVKVSTQLDIYCFYLQELDKNRKEKNCVIQSISNTAEEFKITDRSVYRAIKFIQS